MSFCQNLKKPNCALEMKDAPSFLMQRLIKMMKILFNKKIWSSPSAIVAISSVCLCLFIVRKGAECHLDLTQT